MVTILQINMHAENIVTQNSMQLSNFLNLVLEAHYKIMAASSCSEKKQKQLHNKSQLNIKITIAHTH